MWGFITITKLKNAANIQCTSQEERESQRRKEYEIDCNFSHMQRQNKAYTWASWTKQSIHVGIMDKTFYKKIMELLSLDRAVYIGVISTNDEELLLQILDADSSTYSKYM